MFFTSIDFKFFGVVMNFDKIPHLSSSVKKKVNADAKNSSNIKNFINTSKYFADLVKSLDGFLKPVSGIEQSYVRRYSDEPKGCGGIPMLIFAKLNENGTKKAGEYAWIAKIPLLPNRNCVPIYFPTEIIANSSLARPEPSRSGNHHFSIPFVLDDLIRNPSHFLSLTEIEKRVNR